MVPNFKFNTYLIPGLTGLLKKCQQHNSEQLIDNAYLYIDYFAGGRHAEEEELDSSGNRRRKKEVGTKGKIFRLAKRYVIKS